MGQQGKRLPDAVISSVVADLYLGKPWEQIARDNDISQGSVSNIANRYVEDYDRITKATPTLAQINNLVTNHIVRSLVTSDIQLEQFGDRAWLAQQSAGELAILFGVIDDKRVRLLAALQRRTDADAQAPAGERTALDAMGQGDVPQHGQRPLLPETD